MIEIIVLFIGGAYVGWNIGANDAANCIGTSVGSGLISYRKGILLVAVFVMVGALLQGHNVMKTIGKGIVTEQLPVTAVLAALLSAGFFVTLATWFRLPVSTSQAIVGGVAGVGFSTGMAVNMTKLATIAQIWVVCPFLTGLLAIVLYKLLSLPVRKIQRPELWDRVVGVLLVGSASYVAFSLGANDVGNSVGPIANLGVQARWLSLLGGGALALGALTFGHRVTETVGSGITTLDPLSASAAQLAAALGVHFFSVLGIPVSTSQSVVGAVVGVGLVHGIRAIERRRVVEILGGWVATPTVAGLFSFGLYRLISLVFG
ncbi:MAG TPA: inorganic phosphate transporter [Candidatus Acetothermia bacterium]|nr:inorganic phosphate transporter [Candidatus Acetothermia bacterium]